MQPGDQNHGQAVATREALASVIGQIASGDKSAFAKLYGATSRKLYGVAIKILRDQAAAEDVIQEAFLRIWRSAASFNPKLASPISWMVTIVRNAAIDSYRKRRPEFVAETDDVLEIASNEPDPSGEIDLARRRSIAFAALKKLSPYKRKLILQAYFQEQSRERLARQHGVPTGTIKTTLRRTLIDMRKSIDGEGSGRDATAARQRSDRAA